MLAQPIKRPVNPPDATPTPAAAPATRTVYLCKAYSGGTFWSSAHCQTHSAWVDRMATVPAHLSWDQQLDLANTQRKEAAGLYNQHPTPAVQAATRCIALRAEREAIDARYANWKWQPPEVINPDQIRMRALRAEQSQLGCSER